MAAIVIAVATVNTGGALGNSRVIGRRRAIRLRGNRGGADERVIAESLGRFPEQLHTSGHLERRERIGLLPRAGKGIHPRHAGDTELPFEAFIVRLEIIVADGPIHDIVAPKIDARAVGESAFNFIAVNLEVAGHEARRLAGPEQHRTAENVERARAVTQVAGLRRTGAKDPWLVADSFELFWARNVADGIALSVLRRFQRRSTLEGDHF